MVTEMKHPSKVNTTDALGKRKPKLSLAFALHKVEKSHPYLLGTKVFINLSMQHDASDGADGDGDKEEEEVEKSTLPPEQLRTLALVRYFFTCASPVPS